MKKLLLLALVSTLAMSGFTNEADTKAIESVKENARLCEIFKGKVETYESTMRDDDLAEATLISYKKRMSSYCEASSTTDEAKVETVETAKVEIKTPDEVENKRLCKVFIKKAHDYKATMRSDTLAEATLDSYKERVVTHCSSLLIKS